MLTFFYPKIKAEKFWENVTNNGERGLRVRHLIDLISVPAMICYCQCLCVALPAGWHIASIFSDTQQARQPLSVQLFSTKIWETFGELLRFPPFSIAMLKNLEFYLHFIQSHIKWGKLGCFKPKRFPLFLFEKWSSCTWIFIKCMKGWQWQQYFSMTKYERIRKF